MNVFLQRCLDLAQMADSRTFPNPKVGAVIVHKGKIIGEGFHAYAGGPHAEVMAVHQVKDKSLLPESEIFVSLEPCNHFGRTPPCTHLIVQHNIPKVTIGSIDENPLVAGRGVAYLQAQGVEVVIDAQPEFLHLNRIFFTNQLQKRPYIVLKWAESQDGYIAPNSTGNFAITGKTAKRWVHKLRAQHHAIMVGKNTALYDNPQLTTRNFPGINPIRIVWDAQLTLPSHLHLFTDGQPTFLLNHQKSGQENNVRYVNITQSADIHDWLKDVYTQEGICSILVEGGTHVLQQFIDAGAYDEVYRLVGNVNIGEGVKAPHIQMDNVKIQSLGKDILYFTQKRV